MDDIEARACIECGHRMQFLRAEDTPYFEGQFMIVGCSLMSIALRHDCLPLGSQILTAHKIFITRKLHFT